MWGGVRYFVLVWGSSLFPCVVVEERYKVWLCRSFLVWGSGEMDCFGGRSRDFSAEKEEATVSSLSWWWFGGGTPLPLLCI